MRYRLTVSGQAKRSDGAPSKNEGVSLVTIICLLQMIK
ncbi:hypothetical protein bpmyx0001_57860 [Bacillus pseudomycoides DSM 12442]|nr:hypothetical protein bpmyx0001_57860 [Bacillus pseudomycoides DSM 12442]